MSSFCAYSRPHNNLDYSLMSLVGQTLHSGGGGGFPTLKIKVTTTVLKADVNMNSHKVVGMI